MSELALDVPAAGKAAARTPAALSPWRIVWRRFRRHPFALGAIAVLAAVVLSALLAPLGQSPTDQHPANALQPPSAEHWFGTDDLGRDVLARTLYGGRISLLVGLASTVLTLLAGVAIGMLAGYASGWVDNILMRITDAFLTLPTLFVLILISTLLRDSPALSVTSSVGVVILVIAILSWMWPARLVRSVFLTFKHQDFVTAARCVGATPGRIMFRHMLPNAVGLVIVQGTLLVAAAIITESGLSYLGFGVQPPTPSWGNLLSTAQVYALRAPWLMIFPGLMIFITSMAINYIGDGLRDAYDPHAARKQI